MDPAFKSGNVAVVTGAALGIGRAAATRFAEIGMRVVLVDLSSGDFDETANRLKDTFGDNNILKAELSVTDVEGLNDLASDVTQVFAVPSVVMNNAASRVGGDCFADKADWRQTFEVNLWGVVNGTDAFATMMIEAGGPRRISGTCFQRWVSAASKAPW